MLDKQIQEAICSIELGNNGYANIGINEAVANGVRDAGYIVIATTDLHGKPVFRGFTRKAQEALRHEPFGVSTYKPLRMRAETPDFEAAILARQVDHLFA